MNKIKRFNKYTRKEIADAFVFPVKETKKQRDHDGFALRILRDTVLRQLTPQKKLLFTILQLRYKIEDYINSPDYENTLSFGYFLRQYIVSMEKKMKDFAAEVDIKSVELSQIVNDYRKPKDEFIIRLGIHSNQTIPTIFWYKLLQKEREYNLINNRSLWREANRHVSNKLPRWSGFPDSIRL